MNHLRRYHRTAHHQSLHEDRRGLPCRRDLGRSICGLSVMTPINKYRIARVRPTVVTCSMVISDGPLGTRGTHYRSNEVARRSRFDGRLSDMGRSAMQFTDETTIDCPYSSEQTLCRSFLHLIALICLVAGSGVVFLNGSIVLLGTGNGPDGTSVSGRPIHPFIVTAVPHQPINHTRETGIEDHCGSYSLPHGAH